MLMKRLTTFLSCIISVLLILSAVAIPAGGPFGMAGTDRLSADRQLPGVSYANTLISGSALPDEPVSAAPGGLVQTHPADAPEEIGQTLSSAVAVPEATEASVASASRDNGTDRITADAEEATTAAPDAAADRTASDISAAAAGDARQIPADSSESASESALPAARQTTASRNAAAARNEITLPTIDTFFPLEFQQDYTGMLTSVDERHVYTFSVTQRGFLQYTVKHAELHNFMGWEITLYREYYLNGVDGEIGYMPMNLLKTTSLATTEGSPTVGVIPGEYRLVVKATSGLSAEEYTLNAVFTAALNHEIECNDTKAAYTELYPGIPMIGSASCYNDKQDDDWYLLRVQKDGKLSITFTHATQNSVSVAWRVALYDESGTELYSENSGLNTETVASGEIGLTKGVYFLAVLGRVHCDADYTLSVTTAADDHFERENNDSMASANALALGGTVNGCITSKAGSLDRDFFRFEMPARGNFSMVFSHSPVSDGGSGKKDNDKNGWNIRLLSASGNLIYSMISTWNTSSVKMPVMGLEAGVYYVEINSEDLYRNTTTYMLIAGNTASSSFETEPNNTPDTATPIAQGIPVTGAIIDALDPDDDYYSFSVSAYSRVTAVLKHESNSTERDIFCFSVWNEAGEKMPVYSGRQPLTDADGNNVYYVKSLGNQPSVTAYFELPAGTYYFKVTSGRFFDKMNYSMEYYLN